MMRSMFSAVSGLKTQQVMLDVAANDLANVNTIGFKGSRTTFKDQLQQLMRSSAQSNAGFGGSNAAQIGLGVALGSIDNLMNSGAIQATGNALDVAIQGDGWFRVGSGVPVAGNPTAATPVPANEAYTRAGNFTRNDQGYLTTQTGEYIIGRTAPGGGVDSYINIPAGATDVAIGPDGSVNFTAPAGYVSPAALPPVTATGRAVAGYISLAKFPNEQGLERLTGNRWKAGQNAGTETVGTPGQGGTFGAITSGALEMSNVDLATEFTQMITAQRGFQANSRVISSSDEMLQDLVNLHR
jgi:flagellar hook protein FlgE